MTLCDAGEAVNASWGPDDTIVFGQDGNILQVSGQGGPPDVLVKGSVTVLIMSRPAVRMGDMCAHGGTVVLGFPMVLIGG